MQLLDVLARICRQPSPANTAVFGATTATQCYRLQMKLTSGKLRHNYTPWSHEAWMITWLLLTASNMSRQLKWRDIENPPC